MRPQRSGSGQRMYRRKDIQKFLRIRHLLHEQGFTVPALEKSQDENSPSKGSTMADGRVKDVLDRLNESDNKLRRRAPFFW